MLFGFLNHVLVANFFTLIMLDVSFVTKINLNFSKKVRFWRTGPDRPNYFGSVPVRSIYKLRSGPVQKFSEVRSSVRSVRSGSGPNRPNAQP